MRRKSNPFSKGSRGRRPEATSDLWLKVIAVALAFLLWTVTKSDSRKVVRNVPVRVVNSDAEWVITDYTPPSVDVRVSGPVRELIRLTANRAFIEVRIADVTDSVTRLPLRPTNVQLLDGVDSTRVEAVLGDSVRVVFGSIVERVLPVAPRAADEPRDGYILAGPLRAIPANVRVRGASARVFATGLDSIILPPVDIGDLTRTDTTTVTIDLDGLGLLSVFPETVDVVVPVRPEPRDTTPQGDVAVRPRPDGR